MTLLRRIRDDPRERAAAIFMIAVGVPTVAGIAVAAALEIWWLYIGLLVLAPACVFLNGWRLRRDAKLGRPPAPPMRAALLGTGLVGVSVVLLVLTARG